MALILRRASRHSKDEGQQFQGPPSGCGLQPNHLKNCVFLRRA